MNLSTNAERDDILLEIKNLTVVYKTDTEVVEAVNDLSFAVHRGKTLGLVGETGAGKTTTALSIMRLLPHPVAQIKQGSIRFNGEDLLGLDKASMHDIRGDRISMVFQDPMTSLNPVLTVGDQIAESIKLHNKNLSKEQIEQRVDDTLSMVGILPSRKVEYPHQFSGGMRQRVVIAMALSCNPELLIADEPTTALDVTIQAQIIDLLLKLREKINMGILLITHDLGVVAEIADRVIVMYGGKIMEEAPVKELFRNPLHPYTQGLIDSIPRLDLDVDRLRMIRGVVPNPLHMPAGCPFSTRCDRCGEGCVREVPELVDVGGGHTVRCVLYGGGGPDAAIS